MSKTEARYLIWEAAWPCILATQNRSVAQVLLYLKLLDKVLMIYEHVYDF